MMSLNLILDQVGGPALLGRNGVPFGPDTINLQSELSARLGQKYLSTCLIIIIIVIVVIIIKIIIIIIS